MAGTLHEEIAATRSRADGSSHVTSRVLVLTLIAAFLGWMFDGFEQGLFPIVARPALRSMLGPGGEGAVGSWMGLITAAFLLGAALGGLVFGWLGDRIGRVRAMALSILVYSLFSAPGFFATAPWQLGVFRFISSVGMGGEWALGVALTMEVWPDAARPKVAGTIGAASNVGFLLVGAVAAAVSVTTTSWRWVFLIGAVPALLTFFIRLFVPESQRWQHSQEVVSKRERVSPVSEVFGPRYLGRTLIGIVMSSVALIGTWGSVQWVPLWADQLTGGVMPQAASTTGMTAAVGAIFGCFLAPVLLGRLPRRWGYFILCTLSLLTTGFLFRTQTAYGPVFLAATFATGGATAAFYGFFPLYLPELFPTRMRATGQGVCYNMSRVFAAAGALMGGQLVAYYGGYAGVGAVITLIYLVGMAAVWLAPETLNRGLPE
jgi:MFS family permease